MTGGWAWPGPPCAEGPARSFLSWRRWCREVRQRARPGASCSHTESTETARCPRGGQQRRFAGRGRGWGPAWNGRANSQSSPRRRRWATLGEGAPLLCSPALGGGLQGWAPAAHKRDPTWHTALRLEYSGKPLPPTRRQLTDGYGGKPQVSGGRSACGVAQLPASDPAVPPSSCSVSPKAEQGGAVSSQPVPGSRAV